MNRAVQTRWMRMTAAITASVIALALSATAQVSAKKPGGGGGSGGGSPPPDPGFRYDKVMLSEPGDSFSDALAMNDRGDVVGRKDGLVYTPLWWRYEDYSRVDLNVFLLDDLDDPYRLTEAIDINDRLQGTEIVPQIVGHCIDWSTYDAEAQTIDTHGFLLDTVSGYIDYIKAGPGETRVVAVNDSGDVLGYYGGQAFVWTQGQLNLFEYPGAGFPESISNRRGDGSVWIVGTEFRTTFNPTVNPALVGPREHLTTAIGTLMKGGKGRTFGADVNSAGVIVGDTNVTREDTQAYRYIPGVGMRGLGTLPDAAKSPDSYATAINEEGEIVGISDSGPFPAQAGFVYVNDAMHNLDNLILGLPDAEKGQYFPADITQGGDICGSTPGATTTWTQQAFVL